MEDTKMETGSFKTDSPLSNFVSSSASIAIREEIGCAVH